MLKRVVYSFLIWVIRHVVGERHTTDSLAEIRQAVAESRAVLVDVRERDEWDSGHLRDAVLLPLSRIRAGVPQDELLRLLPAGVPIYLHCGAGGRCLLAAGKLRGSGRDLRPLKPGYDDLDAAGFPRADS